MARRVGRSRRSSWYEVKRYVQDGKRWCYRFLLVSCLFTGLESRSTEPVSAEDSDHSSVVTQSAVVACCFFTPVRSSYANFIPQVSDRKTESDAMDIFDTGTPVVMGRTI